MNADAQQDEVLEPGALIGDHFVIRSQLGSGGMGDVYLAEHATLPDIKCAVKVLRRELSANEAFVGILRAEARKQARLEHDNVVQIRDFFEWNGRYCLVQGFVKGETLNRLIASSPMGLDLRLALRIICDVLSGLDYAHEQGILHCDIKPSNIIIDESGRARILDFGIARDLGASSGDSDVLSAGTPDYMSPEQILPPYELDHRTDVYSSGVTLFQMLSGRLPFDRVPTQVDAEMPQVRLDPPDVRRFRPNIPEVLARIIVTATQRDRDRRFAACADFRDAIIAYQRRERWRRTWLPAIATSVVIAAGIGFALWQWSLRVQHKNILSASASIGTAAESLGQLCREAEERQRKNAGLTLALKMQDEEGQHLVDGFKHQLADIDINIAGMARNYLGALNQLRALPAMAVGKGKALALQSAASEDRQWAAGIVASDYEALRSGRATPPSSEALIQRCRPPAGGVAPSSQQPTHN